MTTYTMIYIVILYEIYKLDSNYTLELRCDNETSSAQALAVYMYIGHLSLLKEQGT